METRLHGELYVTNITVLDSWHKYILQQVKKIFQGFDITTLSSSLAHLDPKPGHRLRASQ